MRPGAEPEGTPVAKEPLHVPLSERDGLGEDGANRVGERSVPDVDRVRHELLAALVRHPHDRGVEIEHLDDGARKRVERLVEPEALREGARHLVERADLPRRRALGCKRCLALPAEQRRLLVELRVLDCDRELSGERGKQRSLVRTGGRPPRRVRRKKSHDVAPRRERDCESRADARLPGRVRRLGEPGVPRDVHDLEHGTLARRAERDVEQPVGDARVRAGQVAAGRFLERAVARAPEVDGHAIHLEQLRDPLDGGLQGVRDRELRRRLDDDLEQCLRPLELEREEARVLARPERMRCADPERRQPCELLRIRLLARAMEQLQHAERRPAERQRGRYRRVLREPGDLHRGGFRLCESTFRDLSRRLETRGRLDSPRSGGDERTVATLPEDGGGSPCDPGGEADDLGRGVLLFQRDRERLAGQLECRPHERRDVAAAAERAQHERSLRGTQLGGNPLLCPERLAQAVELDRDGVAACPRRHQQKPGGADAPGKPAHRGRSLGEVVERRFREL